jgi:hypothetical protein
MRQPRRDLNVNDNTVSLKLIAYECTITVPSQVSPLVVPPSAQCWMRSTVLFFAVPRRLKSSPASRDSKSAIDSSIGATVV